jgi:uncharacterized protein (DUF608 family)
MHEFNESYRGEHLSRIAFPMGGIGAGMVCLSGTGCLTKVSLRHRPNVFKEPLAFAALCVRGEGENTARVLEAPVPAYKPLTRWGQALPVASGSGAPGRSYGLPRLREAEFRTRFPFGVLKLGDPALPLGVELTGWSPFLPGNADDSSWPVAALEYRFVNESDGAVEAVFSFHSTNFMFRLGAGIPTIEAMPGGFVLQQPGSEEQPHVEGAFSVSTDHPGVTVDCRWFRGGWFDSLSRLWNRVTECRVREAAPYDVGLPSQGASLYVPLTLAPGQEQTVRLRLAWYVPMSDLHNEFSRAADGAGADPQTQPATYRPWYAERFDDIGEVSRSWAEHYERLRAGSQAFTDCFYDTTLPPEVVEAVSANLGILKSPTVLRQADGRLWAWEGCGDDEGCCAGSCTHVWNYAQALPHLFPDLERSLRLTEFLESQDEAGHQNFRASLPIRPTSHDFHAAADGQLGGIMKVYRDWRISGDRAWLERLWPRVKQSLAYAIETWDPDRRGVLIEPHHNTYDIEFWGADSMCSSFYVGALKAAILMAAELGEDAGPWAELYEKGRRVLEEELFNGEYFFQKVQWEGLRSPSPLDPATQTLDQRQDHSPEEEELLQQEGPKYQYGAGCLSDGVLGAWMARVCGIGQILDPARVKSHLRAVHRHNLRHDLSEHANPQRPGYAFGDEGGLLLCTWPRGDAPSLPFVYSNEVWTGIEYQVASHLIMEGSVDEGLEIVRTARRRYDGRDRDPFDEIECGHWYARALASYSLLQALSGARYDAVEKKLYLRPPISGDYRAFIATATGFGSVGVQEDKPFLEVRHGEIEVDEIEFG